MLLEPKTTYTIFLLPFAYHPVRPKEKEKRSVEYEWRDLRWDSRSSPVIAASEQSAGDSGQCKADERKLLDEADDHKLAWRLQYFLPETNVVLFQRARWFVLQREREANDGPQVAAFPWPLTLAPTSRAESLPLKVHWARLVLFEWADPGNAGALDQVAFARNGVLAVKIGFDAGSRFLPTIEYLLQLNEAVRYYRIPYLRHPEFGFKRHEIVQGLPGPSEDEGLCASYGAMWHKLLAFPLKLKSGYCNLFHDDWGKRARKQAMVGEEAGQDVPGAEALLDSPLVGLARKPTVTPGSSAESWDVYPDNRAFVWTCANVIPKAEEEDLRDLEDKELPAGRRPGKWTALWHALLDVDAQPGTVDAFRRNWLWKRTYRRWVSEGTVYGFNNFSVAVMGKLNPIVPVHFERMYLDMGLLLLQIRTSLFRASHEISANTQSRLAFPASRKWEEVFRRFRDDFSAFVNLYQFPLLSTQQQAIEMYALMRKWMDVDDIFAEVKSEIESTHEMAELEARKRTENALEILTLGGIGLACAGVASQIVSPSSLSELWPCKPPSCLLWYQVAVTFASGLIGASLAWACLRLTGRAKGRGAWLTSVFGRGREE